MVRTKFSELCKLTNDLQQLLEHLMKKILENNFLLSNYS